MEPTPFAPADRHTAEEMQQDVERDYHKVGPGVGMDSIRRTLLQSWKTVDTTTRKQCSKVLLMILDNRTPKINPFLSTHLSELGQ